MSDKDKQEEETARLLETAILVCMLLALLARFLQYWRH
jgi:hypothetical protein